MNRIKADPTRFFDPTKGRPSQSPVALFRSMKDFDEEWQMMLVLGYDDRHFGPITVPGNKQTFTTDLTSVPQLMTWLVPRTGVHLPAALIHDGLTPPERGEFVCANGAGMTQRDADRIFRDGMADLCTPPIQRWMIWSAVSIPTGAKMVPKWFAPLLYLGLLLTAYLGVMATLDLLGVAECVPWMRGSSALSDTLWGLGGALVIPLVTALPWLRAKLYTAGLISCWGIAFLLHATLVLLIATAIYQLAEYRTQLPARLVNGKLLKGIRGRMWIAGIAGLAVIGMLTGLTIVMCRYS